MKELDGKQLLEYVSDELILETKRFEKVKPKEFDLSGYKESLTDYLNDSIKIVLNGEDPSEGKILKEEIQQAMRKKFSRL